MDDEVEVDEIILHVERIQAEGSCFNLRLCYILRISIGYGNTFCVITLWAALDLFKRELEELGSVVKEGEEENGENVKLPDR